MAKNENLIEMQFQVGGQGNVWAALDLIDYEKRVEPAIMHLFGNTLICRCINSFFHPIFELHYYNIQGPECRQ